MVGCCTGPDANLSALRPATVQGHNPVGRISERGERAVIWGLGVFLGTLLEGWWPQGMSTEAGCFGEALGSSQARGNFGIG